MPMRDNVAKLIETGKQLKMIADHVSDVEVKSQLLGVVFQVQEVHDAILADWEDSLEGVQKDEPAAEQNATQTKSFLISAAEKSKARIEATGTAGTYAIKPPPKPEPLEATEIVDLDADDESEDATESNADQEDGNNKPAKPADGKAKPAAGSETAAGGDADAEVAVPLGRGQAATSDSKLGVSTDTAEIETAAAVESAGDMTPEQRAKMAEFRISELEPLQQAALKRVNDILTKKQQQVKANATKAGRKSGKQGVELQQHVLAALNLTDEQKNQMALARKELHNIRMAIAKEVEHLVSDEQKTRMKSQLGIR